jgi:hypothetical protein
VEVGNIGIVGVRHHGSEGDGTLVWVTHALERLLLRAKTYQGAKSAVEFTPTKW